MGGRETRVSEMSSRRSGGGRVSHDRARLRKNRVSTSTDPTALRDAPPIGQGHGRETVPQQSRSGMERARSPGVATPGLGAGWTFYHERRDH